MGAGDTKETRGRTVTYYLVQRPGCVSTQFRPLSFIFYLLSKAWVHLNSQHSFILYIISIRSMPLNHCHHSDVIIEDHHSRLASVSALKLKYAIALMDMRFNPLEQIGLDLSMSWPILGFKSPKVSPVYMPTACG